MKKLIALPIILIIALLSTMMFSSCNKSVADTLISKWQDYEVYEYEVFDGEELIGTLTYSSERLKESLGNTTITINGEEHTKVIGTLIDYSLNINNGDYVKAQTVFTANTFRPLYTHKEMRITDNGKTTETVISANYKGKYYDYTIKTGETETKDTRTISSGFYFQAIYCCYCNRYKLSKYKLCL